MRRLLTAALRRHAPIVIAAVAAVIWLACGDPAGVYDEDSNEFDLARDTNAPIQTDRLEYTLRSVEARLATRIAFEWTNPTGQTVYVANCPVEGEPLYRVDLLRESGAVFEPALASAELECAGAPLRIEPGGTFTDTVDIVASRPGGPEPAFRFAPVRGVYRMLIRSAFHTYDLEHDILADSLPTLTRVSNRFGLIEPD